MRVTKILIAAFLAAATPAAAKAVECRSESFDGGRFSVCEVTLPEEDLRVFQSAPDGQIWGQFSALEEGLREEGLTLRFAMNGGMYHADRAPVGHLVIDGEERMRLITNPGPGNFGLLPNGVLCVTGERAHVMETLAFERSAPVCEFASQSGPMLVIDGELHPKFRRESDSRLIRNGVGVTSDGSRALFAMSEGPVNFHHFARLFRDHLGTPNALFIDGNVSRLHAPGMGRSDPGPDMGPIVGVVEPAE
jgi:uncharacterized protein YigE (DUF2233 family)